MPTRFRMTVTARRKPCPCDSCEKEIPEGLIYATAAIYFGTSKAGKERYKTLKLHMIDCLAMWMVKDYLRHKERVKDRRGGRPSGTGLDLAPEIKLERKRLMWRRAYMIRQFLTEPNTCKAKSLIMGALKVDAAMKDIAPISTKMVRRNPKMAEAVRKKCKELEVAGTWNLLRHL